MKLNKSDIERGNRDERSVKPVRLKRSCVKFQNDYSCQDDEANLLKCCEDKVKVRGSQYLYTNPYQREDRKFGSCKLGARGGKVVLERSFFLNFLSLP